MKPVPKDATRLPPEIIASGILDLETGHKYAWTEVQGKVTKRTQTEEGMGKGQAHYRIDFQCPRCEESHFIHSTDAHGKHVLRCFCDATLVFRVVW